MTKKWQVHESIAFDWYVCLFGSGLLGHVTLQCIWLCGVSWTHNDRRADMIASVETDSWLSLLFTVSLKPRVLAEMCPTHQLLTIFKMTFPLYHITIIISSFMYVVVTHQNLHFLRNICKVLASRRAVHHSELPSKCMLMNWKEAKS